MGKSAPLTVAVVFGGRSVEHDVSIITGIQACEVLSARHHPVPVYIDRDGHWYAGQGLTDLAVYRDGTYGEYAVSFDVSHGVIVPAAPPRQRGLRGLTRGGAAEPWRPDVVLAATHGTQGEDGCLQGLLELADLAYVGPTLESAVLAMNKSVTKQLLRVAGIPVIEDLLLRREAYRAEGGPEAVSAEVVGRFGLPVYVKPLSLGSSVGVTRASTEQELLDGLELAFELDRQVLIEPAVQDAVEVNCAVVGRPGVTPRSSACEQPISTTGFLSFEDKYMRGSGGKGGTKAAGAAPAGAAPTQAGSAAATMTPPASGPAAGAKSAGMASAQRLIPAPIGDEQTARVKDLAERSFTALGCAGVTRIDMLIDSLGNIFVNECNTIPGSFAFYLWEPVGVSFADLMDELLRLARDEHEERLRTTRTFATNLLASRVAGAAGAKV